MFYKHCKLTQAKAAITRTPSFKVTQQQKCFNGCITLDDKEMIRREDLSITITDFTTNTTERIILFEQT